MVLHWALMTSLAVKARQKQMINHSCNIIITSILIRSNSKVTS